MWNCWKTACIIAAVTDAVLGAGNVEKNTEGEKLRDSVQLTTISYGAKIGINVTLTLSKQDYGEECYLKTPQGEIINLEDTQINGVHVYPISTNFVSCRVVIGPMEEDLLGTWTLCGRHSEGDNEYERCQTGHISWAIPNPADNWASTIQPNFRHVVNYGFSLSPAVRGSGTINTCHVVTPANEDISLTSTSDYPGLTRFINNRDVNTCNVTIGPIDANFIGDWVLYGTYNGNAGFNVHTQPMTFFLYDEENPYNQAYNITSLTMQSHLISVRGTIIVSLTGSGVRDGCEFITNTGEHHDNSLTSSLETVEFINNNNAVCRLQIGPITPDMFGDWLLIGKFSRGNVFNELQLPFQLLEEDPANPIPDSVERPIENLAPRNFSARFGESYEVTTNRGSNIAIQSCHIRTPENLQYVLREGWVQPGVEGLVGSGISCGVRVHVKDEDAVGEWMLISRIAIRGVPTEWRTIFNINLEEDQIEGSVEEESVEDPGPTMLTPINYAARLGVNITITLSKKDYDEECYLQTPQGDVIKFEDAQLSSVQVYPTSTNFVSCRVVIGPLDQTLLGTWTLCGKHIEEESVRERCQPGHITGAIDNWAATTHANFDHVVHYGFSLAPIVRGTGVLNTCHIVTPNGEDIALTQESDYPGLSFVVLRDTTACSVNIGAIDENFLGSWVLYGTYNSIALGFNVVTLPMTFFLYDEENPYNQAYNVTQLEMVNHVLTEGLTVELIVTGSGTRDGCEFITNTGEVHDQASSVNVPGVTFVNNNNAACRLQVGPVTKDMFGEWRLIGKFRRNNVLFNEFQLPFRLIEEDPANPIPDDVERAIEYVSAQDIYTSFGNSHTFSTATHNRMATDSCHLRTPDRLQYILRSGLVQPGFQTVAQSNMSCGVQVHINNEDAIGEWMLIARVSVQGARIERRLPFTIHVEEEVNAVPNLVTIAEGNDLYLRLENSTSLYESCVLIGPVRNNAERDENYVDSCGFIVRDITLADAGTWEIEYGKRVKYRAFINVNVTGRFESDEINDLRWEIDAPVNVTIGPADTVYCRVEDPTGLIVFQGFGRCNIVLDQVRSEHAGVWKSTIGMAGRVRADTHEFVVKLSEAAPKDKVITSVVSEKPLVMLSCRVEGEREVTACKFRDPSGKVLLASQGVGEDRYSFHGVGVSIHSEVSNSGCGLRITNPVVEDLGLWRCAIETKDETYYGFLSVLCPWAMRDPDLAAAVVSVPTLASETDSIKVVEGNAVTIRCSVQSAIRYCYFRAQNGTIINVTPGISEWFQYVGAGLDSGECSVRFPGLQASDSGRWSCHVGFKEHSEPEQFAQINVHVDAEMVAEQYYKEDEFNTLVVRGQVHSLRTLEYCRFVRIDGQGFTSENAPTGYEDHSLLANGKCEIRIRNPNILEQHPWTVVAKMVGYHSELARSTQHTLTVPEEIPETTDRPELEPEYREYRDPIFLIMWSLVPISLVALIAALLLLGPKKNRDWTFQRVAFVRNSLRKSLIKKSIPAEENSPTQTTPIVA